jgi:tetratricopeptide (TPR) repeat protein
VAGLHDIYDQLVGKIVTPEARLLLVQRLKREGNAQTVIHACKKVLDTFPDDVGIRTLLAETYFEEGSLDLAAMETEKIVSEIKALSYIFKFQAKVFRRQNKIDNAIHALKLYLAHNEEDQQAADLLSEISQPKEQPSALPTPTLAELYYNQGELGEAINVYEQVVASSPDNEKARHRLDELRAEQATQEEVIEKREGEKESKSKLLEVLERWLAALEERKAIPRAQG